MSFQTFASKSVYTEIVESHLRAEGASKASLDPLERKVVEIREMLLCSCIKAECATQMKLQALLR